MANRQLKHNKDRVKEEQVGGRERKFTISGAHKQLEGAKDGAIEGPAQEGHRAGTRPLHGEAQSIVLVLHMPLQGKDEPNDSTCAWANAYCLCKQGRASCTCDCAQ